MVLMRENPPATFALSDPRRVDLDELDLDLALGALSRQVSKGQAQDRLDAVNGLIWLRDRRALSPFVRALSDPEWDVRLSAAAGLSGFERLPDWVLPPVGVALVDPEPGVRVAAARALGRAAGEPAVQLLDSALDDGVRAVVIEAIWALYELGCATITDVRVAWRIARFLDHADDPRLAVAAYWACRAQGGSAMDEPRSAFRLSDAGQAAWEVVTGQR